MVPSKWNIIGSIPVPTDIEEREESSYFQTSYLKITALLRYKSLAVKHPLKYIVQPSLVSHSTQRQEGLELPTSRLAYIVRLSQKRNSILYTEL